MASIQEGVHDRYTQKAISDGVGKSHRVMTGQVQISRFPRQIRIF